MQPERRYYRPQNIQLWLCIQTTAVIDELCARLLDVDALTVDYRRRNAWRLNG